MGSFSVTCCVSGLPIEAGDPVRFFLLTQNPYREHLKCYLHDLYFPRVFPLRAEYNDYGSVERVEGGGAQQAWLDAFKLDLIQLGWGGNSCHDVATSKDMTFEAMLNAAWEGRLCVRDGLDMWALEPEVGKMLGERRKKPKVPAGVPTRKRVEKVLKDANVSTYGGNWGNGLIVGRQGYGRIRVRPSSGLGSDELAQAEEALRKAGYATMLTKGVGSYTRGAELLVRPLPTVEEYRMPRDKQKVLPVKQAMIREDVWQALTTLSFQAWVGRGEKTVTVDHFRDAAQEVWSRFTTKDNGRAPLSLLLSLGGGSGLADWFTKDPVPFVLGIGTSFQVVAKRRLAGDMTDAEAKRFVDTAAEFMFLHGLFGHVRYQWRPTYSNGPQFGEWQLHARVFEQLSKVTSAAIRERRSRLGEDDPSDESLEG